MKNHKRVGWANYSEVGGIFGAYNFLSNAIGNCGEMEITIPVYAKLSDLKKGRKK